MELKSQGMEIILIRHTSVAVSKSVCYGRSNVGLADTFDAEKEILLGKLGLTANPVVYSSPASRCIRLSESISPAYRTDDRLRELDFGRWEMLPWTEIPESELNPWMSDFVNANPPGGENFVTLHNRTENFLREILRTNHSHAVVVTHAGVIRSLVCHCLGIPLENAFRLQVDYGFVCRISYRGGVPSVRF